MGNFTSNSASITQEFYNNVTQENQESCIVSNTTTAEGNTIIVSGARIDGNFVGVQVASNTDSTCLLSSSMGSTIENILEASLKQTNKTSTDWFNGFQFNKQDNIFNIKQSVSNNIAQINEQTCASNSIVSANNNYIYLNGGTVGGDFIGVDTTSNFKANCAITNAMKNSTYNRAQASSNQSNSVTGMWAALMSVIAALIGLGVVVVIGVASVGGIGAVGYAVHEAKSSGSTGPQSAPSELQRDIMAEQQLGISPQALAIAEAESRPGIPLQPVTRTSVLSAIPLQPVTRTSVPSAIPLQPVTRTSVPTSINIPQNISNPAVNKLITQGKSSVASASSAVQSKARSVAQTTLPSGIRIPTRLEKLSGKAPAI